MTWLASCPLASPLASSRLSSNASIHGAIGARPPANDCPVVRPPPVALATAADRVGDLGCCDVGDSVSVIEARGVAITCPLPGPLAWSTDPRVHLSTPSPLPTKEMRNERPGSCPLGPGGGT
jgi:hypothetical protein